MILEEQLKEMRDELYKDFMVFIDKTAKYHSLTQQLMRMQNDLKKFQRKHNGGSSLEERRR